MAKGYENIEEENGVKGKLRGHWLVHLYLFNIKQLDTVLNRRFVHLLTKYRPKISRDSAFRFIQIFHHSCVLYQTQRSIQIRSIVSFKMIIARYLISQFLFNIFPPSKRKKLLQKNNTTKCRNYHKSKNNFPIIWNKLRERSSFSQLNLYFQPPPQTFRTKFEQNK